MNLKIRIFVSLFFFTALVFINKETQAQKPGGGGGGKPCGGRFPPCPTPITGIEILIAGGAAFGIKKLMKTKKSNL